MRIRYRSTPTLARFHASPAFVRGVMGPIGSGKSSAMCLEMIIKSLQQPANSHNVRRSRWAVVRNTYPELRTTTIKTWTEWAPEALARITWSHPVTCRFATDMGNAGRLDMEVLFMALNRPDDARKLLSLELTGAWINEAREVPKAVVDGLIGRVGRFPPKRDAKPGSRAGWSGVIMDTNPPDDDHWWYKLAEEHRPQGWEFFRQPPPLLQCNGEYRPNPDAENVENLPAGHDYWLRQIPGKTAEWIKVYILGQYGVVESGRPVYPEYDDARHAAAANIAPMAGRPLILGWDFGLTPACVFAQVCPRGRLLVLDELQATGLGVRSFARDAVRPLLDRRFPGLALRSVGDPAGRTRAQTDERTCMDELAAAKLPTQPARTNEFMARREAVAGFLSTQLDDMPAFQLSPRCKQLRKGFLGGYKLERVQTAGEERYKDQPAKNMYSHLHDALQYAALAAEAGHGAARKAGRKTPGFRPADAGAGY